jgi:hypothetical protein
VSGFEWIVALAIIYWVVKGGLSDLTWAVRGQAPPRVTEGRARAAAAGRRYGARKYMADLWSDAWLTARAKREARVAQRLDHIREHGPGPTWRQKASDRMSAAWGRWETRMSHRWQQRRERDGQTTPEPVAPVERDRPDTTREPDSASTREDQNQQRGEKREPAEPVTVTPYDPEQDRREPQDLTASPDGRWQVMDDTPDPRGQQNQTKERDEHMAEVTGLASALAHAAAMRQAYEDSTADSEQYAASLAAGGVTGEALAAVQQAMEAQQAAAAAWGQAEATLSRHMAVKEAYDANQDAGTREFVTAE